MQPLRIETRDAERQQPRSRGLQHVLAPPVGDPRPLGADGLCTDRQAGRHADRQRVVVDHALAQAMDRVHCHLVDARERHAQRRARAARRGVVQTRGAGHAERLDDGARAPFEPVVEQALELDDALPDARGKLGGGGVGEGDHQHLLQAETPLDQRAHDQSGDGPGLARAGVGLEQVQAVEDVDIEHRMGGQVGVHVAPSRRLRIPMSSNSGR